MKVHRLITLQLALEAVPCVIALQLRTSCRLEHSDAFALSQLFLQLLQLLIVLLFAHAQVLAPLAAPLAQLEFDFVHLV